MNSTYRFLHHLAAIAAACVSLAALPALASAADYPDSMIKVIVPFGPGGAAQALAERVGAEIAKNIGQPLVHDYRGGAAGMIAAEAAAKASPNGYTVLMGVPSALIVAPLVMKSVARFDPVKDFEPIAGIAATPFVLFINSKLPIKNLRELIDYGKKNPRKLNFGSLGANGTDFIAGQVLQNEAGFEMTNVPYKSVAALLPDVISGRIDVAILSPIPIKPFVDTGKLRMLAVTSAQRSMSPSLKNVPTVAEQGVPGYDIVSWYGYFAPAGVSPAMIQRFHQAAVKALSDKDIKAYLLDQGLTPITLSTADFGKSYSSDLRKWAKFVRETGIPVQ